MKKRIDKVKRYLLICGCAALIFAGLTACTNDEYNNEADGLSGNVAAESAVSDAGSVGSAVSDVGSVGDAVSDAESEENASGDNVYEYQQVVEIDEDGGSGEAEFGYSFSDGGD